MCTGDGANDVAMILEAHVGVGIAGMEGIITILNIDVMLDGRHYCKILNIDAMVLNMDVMLIRREKRNQVFYFIESI